MIHQNIMAKASAHDEKMKNLMRTKAFVSGIEKGKLQGVNNTAHGIDDASGQKPDKGRRRQSVYNFTECQDTYPAHGNVQAGRKPFWAHDEAGFYENA